MRALLGRAAPLVVLLLAASLEGQSNQHPVRICVVQGERLQQVNATYNSTTGDTTVSGRPFNQVHPTGSAYAARAGWYVNNEPITLRGGYYVKFGLPRVLGADEVEHAITHLSVPIFREAGARPALPRGVGDVVYVPVRPGCEFQPYELDPWIAGMLTPGNAAQGRLHQALTDEDGRGLDVWGFEGRRGDRIRIAVSSTAFDPLVRISGRGHVLATDDDGGEGWNSLLEITLGLDGFYGIEATSYAAGRFGDYTVRVDRQPGRSSELLSLGTGAEVSSELTGSLPQDSDGNHYEEFLFHAQAGQRIVVRMDSSDLDAYLEIGTGTGGAFQRIAANDDGGEGSNALLDHTFSRAGEYTIRARSYRHAHGAYELRVQRR